MTQSLTHRLSDLSARTLVAVLLGVTILLVTLAGDFLFLIFWLLIAGGTYAEWLMMLCRRSGVTTWPQRGVAVFAGLLFCGGGVIFLVSMRHDGVAALFFLYAVIWSFDSCAYFAGRVVGGARLWVRVSPGKTWAGVGGGVIGTIIVGLVAAAMLDGLFVTTIAMAIIIGLVGQAGDLAGSIYKRFCGCSDSSSILPGHGGFLDRLDSLFVAAGIPVAASWYGVPLF